MGPNDSRFPRLLGDLNSNARQKRWVTWKTPLAVDCQRRSIEEYLANMIRKKNWKTIEVPRRNRSYYPHH